MENVGSGLESLTILTTQRNGSKFHEVTLPTPSAFLFGR